MFLVTNLRPEAGRMSLLPVTFLYKKKLSKQYAEERIRAKKAEEERERKALILKRAIYLSDYLKQRRENGESYEYVVDLLSYEQDDVIMAYRQIDLSLAIAALERRIRRTRGYGYAEYVSII